MRYSSFIFGSEGTSSVSPDIFFFFLLAKSFLKSSGVPGLQETEHLDRVTKVRTVLLQVLHLALDSSQGRVLHGPHGNRCWGGV